MALPITPTYSDLDTFKAHTPVASQRTIAEDDWKPFALRAEAVLDSYVCISKYDKYDEDQGLAFPIKDDEGNSLIPDNVIRAHIEITSDLILKGDPKAVDGTIETGETWSSSSYSKNKQKKAQSSSDDLKIEMPALARRLLMPWTCRTAPLKY